MRDVMHNFIRQKSEGRQSNSTMKHHRRDANNEWVSEYLKEVSQNSRGGQENSILKNKPILQAKKNMIDQELLEILSRQTVSRLAEGQKKKSVLFDQDDKPSGHGTGLLPSIDRTSQESGLFYYDFKVIKN